MMAINHAVTGALIGLTVEQPAAALPLAFMSHFALDAIPHYDPVTGPKAVNIGSKKFFREQILINGLLCLGLVVMLAITQPKHWLVAAICAFLGASPDFMWIPRFIRIKRTGQDTTDMNWMLRFHSGIQWLTSPRLLPFELLWLAITGALLTTYL